MKLVHYQIKDAILAENYSSAMHLLLGHFNYGALPDNQSLTIRESRSVGITVWLGNCFYEWHEVTGFSSEETHYKAMEIAFILIWK